MAEDELKLAAPLICILAVLVTLELWGRLAAISGAVAASVIFDLLLFPPFGSIRVNAVEEQLALVVLLWAGLALTALGVPKDAEQQTISEKLSSQNVRPGKSKDAD